MAGSQGEGEFFFSWASTPIIVAIFALAAIGVTTCTVEQNRLARWEKELNWKPGADTYIYKLDAGEWSEGVNLFHDCYRTRTDPHDNKMSVAGSLNGVRRDIPTYGDFTDYQERYFKLEKDGYLFLEKASRNARGGCDGVMAAWPASQLPLGSEDRKAVIEQEHRKQEAARAAAEAKQKLEASFDVYQKWLGSGEAMIVTRIRDCMADNVAETTTGLVSIGRVRKANNWVYGSVNVPGQVRAVFFDGGGMNCANALFRIRNNGYLKGWSDVKTAIRWGDAKTAPVLVKRNLRPAPSPVRPRTNIFSEQQKPMVQPREPYKPPPGWRIDDGNCRGNTRYIAEIQGFICQNVAGEGIEQGKRGRWLKCQGTDFWREQQRCPFGQKLFVPD